jgi:type II secretory pathway pseudopilin PulG
MKITCRGMTLLELVIASLLLGWFVAGMMALYQLAQKTMTRIQQIQYASFLAREKLEELAGVGFQKLTQSPYDFDASALDEQIRTESKSEIESSFSSPADVSEFIKRHLVRRITKLQNRDDWNPGGSIDYRKIEITVEWDESPS